MEFKEYQAAALETFSRWRDALEEAERQCKDGAAALREARVAVPEDLIDYPKTAWERLSLAGGAAASAGAYVSRADDVGRPIPHVCFKVPTGGGKTLLAAAALERLNRQTGLTLWITPTRAIYDQTWATLRNREHPYRQLLERASGGRVRLFEKEDPFSAADVANYLCIVLLMLPAANRQHGRDFLRMFRDSGRYPTFFPDNDDILGDARLLNKYPDLERVSENAPVKHSLFNVFKMLRPVVVLDEAHKAYGRKLQEGQEFARSINRLDPCLVLELSATPNNGISNLLVDITGVALKAEEMIKLPVQVTSFTKVEWQHVLTQACEELARLEVEALSLRTDKGRYVRPVAVVRVERTGKDKRDGERVHAEDVREYLNLHLGVSEASIAVKSAERDELANVDLMSELCAVRWIITKSALTEGWDCPFAYVLVMLDNTTAQRAVTQLVGRVLRQPHARRTRRAMLDQCYVHCWNTTVGDAVALVKKGLENEGFTGLGGEVLSVTGQTHPVQVQRRKNFRNQNIFLPLVLHRDGEEWHELDYSRHITSQIDWNSIDPPDTRKSQIELPQTQSAIVDVGDQSTAFHAVQTLLLDKTLKLSWFTRRLSDIVPNPWQAARITEKLLDNLRSSGESDDFIHDRCSFLAYELRKHVSGVLEKQAERIFREKLVKKEIRFDLKMDGPKFTMVDTYQIQVADDAGLLARSDGFPVQLSLFEPVYSNQFDSDLERSFARYLDEQKALHLWHRIASRQHGDYYLKGWKQNRIWPDFVALGVGSGERPNLLIFETKGRHLDNPETEYKKHVFSALEETFNCGTMTVENGPAKGVFRLVFDESEFSTFLAD